VAGGLVGLKILVRGVIAACAVLVFLAPQAPPSNGAPLRPRTAVPPAPQGWSTVFAEDFIGAAGSPPSSANWLEDTGTQYPGGPAHWGTGEVETMTNATANVQLDGQGHLVITPIQSGGAWTSGRIETQRTDFAAPPGGQLQVSASIQQPNPSSGLGYWPAFWMLGSAFRGTYTNWPSVGEIDVMEDVNALSERAGTLHCGTSPGGPCNETTGLTSGLQACGGCQTGYHTYSVIIDRTNTSAEQIRWYLDGVEYFSVSESQVGTAAWQAAVDHGFFLILDVAMGGGFPNGVCGCTTPTATTTSGATMSVEYVAVYESPAPMITTMPPVRLVDTRTAGGAITSGASRCFPVVDLDGIPVDAHAVVLNVTAVGQTTNGWLTVYPNPSATSPGQPIPPTSTLNFGPSEYAIANGILVPVGPDGRVCVAVGTVNAVPGSAQAVLDVTGFVSASVQSQMPTLAQPQRLADTRTAGGPIATGNFRCFLVAGLMGIPADAAAVILNVTAVDYATQGWLTVFPNGPAGPPVPETSTVNFDPSEYAIANNTVMAVGSGQQVCVKVGTVNSAPGRSDVVLDATGYVTAAALGQLPMLATPRRVVDTRLQGGTPIASGTSRCFALAGQMGLPANAAGLVFNVTAVNYATQGWLTVYPSGQPVPPTSTLNFDPSEYAIANGATVALGADGQLCVSVGTVNSVPGSAHVVIDVAGSVLP